MNRWQAVIFIVAGLASVVVGYVGFRTFVADAAKAAPAKVQLAEVRRGNLEALVNTTGSVVAATQAKLSFKTPGRVKEVYVKFGDAVKQGQPLASLDTAELENSLAAAESRYNIDKLKLQQLLAGAKPEEIAAARASYEAALAKYNQLLAGPSQDDLTVARASLDKAQIAVQKAQAEYDKVAWRDDIGTRAEAVTLQQATIDYNSALASFNLKTVGPAQDQIKSAEAALYNAQKALNDKQNGPSDTDVALLREQLKQSEASYEQARLSLYNAVLRATFDGVVLSVAAFPGEQMGGGAAAVVVVDPTSVRVDANVDEMDVSKIRSGQPVVLTLDALSGARLTGKVATVAPSATIVQGVATYPVSMNVDPADSARLKGGMTVGVSIVVEQNSNVLIVPNRAVRTTGKNRWVEVLVDGKAEQRQVRIGMSSDQFTEIAGGLELGEQVVIPTTTTTQPRIGGMGGAAGGTGAPMGGFGIGGR